MVLTLYHFLSQVKFHGFSDTGKAESSKENLAEDEEESASEVDMDDSDEEISEEPAAQRAEVEAAIGEHTEDNQSEAAYSAVKPEMFQWLNWLADTTCEIRLFVLCFCDIMLVHVVESEWKVSAIFWE